MKNFHIKSIILGIGIGIVLTSVVSMIYLAGTNPGEKMATEQIITEAKKLGMVENSELIQDTARDSQPKKEESKKVPEKTENQGTAPVVPTAKTNESKNEQAEKPKEQQEKPKDQEILISVNAGDSSEKVADKLLKAGLISDKPAFVKLLSDMGLASEINIGDFRIKTGTDLKSIVKVLTGHR
ncbi:MAG: endolytic transglycosylase MltG [Clostridia bacterium]|nr:endolytic transglycosylase MltG [Clostridia bacterium]